MEDYQMNEVPAGLFEEFYKFSRCSVYPNTEPLPILLTSCSTKRLPTLCSVTNSENATPLHVLQEKYKLEENELENAGPDDVANKPGGEGTAPDTVKGGSAVSMQAPISDRSVTRTCPARMSAKHPEFFGPESIAISTPSKAVEAEAPIMQSRRKRTLQTQLDLLRHRQKSLIQELDRRKIHKFQTQKGSQAQLKFWSKKTLRRAKSVPCLAPYWCKLVDPRSRLSVHRHRPAAPAPVHYPHPPESRSYVTGRTLGTKCLTHGTKNSRNLLRDLFEGRSIVSDVRLLNATKLEEYARKQ